MEQINALLAKHKRFKDFEIRSITAPLENTILVTLVEQDEDANDVNRVEITFTAIKESRILENSVLSFLDMMSGISIIYERDYYCFAIGHCDSMLSVLNAPLFIIASDIEFKEC